MDTTVLVAIIGGTCTILAAVIPRLISKKHATLQDKEEDHTDNTVELSSRQMGEKELIKCIEQFGYIINKGKALQLEESIFTIVKQDTELFVKYMRQPIYPAQEAMVVVGGRLLSSGVRDSRIISFLHEMSQSPGEWIRRKAKQSLENNQAVDG